MPIGSRPQQFPGTIQEIHNNWLTHHFSHSMEGAGSRCSNCDCREFSTSAGWPCGTRIPREPIYSLEEQAEMARHELFNTYRELTAEQPFDTIPGNPPR